MSSNLGPVALAAAGATGNNTHASVAISPVPQLVTVEFVVEAVGATPTVTYKLQGTMDPGATADGSANWHDLILLPSDNETAAVSITKVAVGSFVQFLAQSHVRYAKRVRLVSTLNTNVTYHASLHSQYRY